MLMPNMLSDGRNARSEIDIDSLENSIRREMERASSFFVDTPELLQRTSERMQAEGLPVRHVYDGNRIAVVGLHPDPKFLSQVVLSPDTSYYSRYSTELATSTGLARQLQLNVSQLPQRLGVEAGRDGILIVWNVTAGDPEHYVKKHAFWGRRQSDDTPRNNPDRMILFNITNPEKARDYYAAIEEQRGLKARRFSDNGVHIAECRNIKKGESVTYIAMPYGLQIVRGIIPKPVPSPAIPEVHYGS